MKRTLTILALLAALALAKFGFSQGLLILAGSPPVASSPIFDDFNRADSASLGANWTEEQGDAKISGNRYVSVTAGFGYVVSIYSATACNTVDQYVRSTMDQFTASLQIHSVFLRYEDAASPFYEVQVSSFGNTIKWFHWTAVGGTQTEIASAAFTPTYPFTLGVAVSGTGNSTVMNVWTDATGLPDGDGDWNGDASPSVNFTTNPSSPVDTGSFVGLGGQTATEFYHEDFAGGDTP